MDRAETISRAKRDEGAGGLLLSPLEGGAWSAIEALRDATVAERRLGRQPRIASFEVLARDGRLVTARDPEASLLALTYRA